MLSRSYSEKAADDIELARGTDLTLVRAWFDNGLSAGAADAAVLVSREPRWPTNTIGRQFLRGRHRLELPA